MNRYEIRFILKKRFCAVVFWANLFLMNCVYGQLDTPVLFIIFNRPVHQQQVFKQIKAVRPRKLFIAADGPRMDVSIDQELCNEARAIVKQVDWVCEVKTLFRDKNLGCGKAVSDAITWAFKDVDECIILEDDTKPSISFFYYCQTMLDYYRNDRKIFHICGNTSRVADEQSYKESKRFYSLHHYMNCWGWATWKRAWDFYDFDLTFLKDPGNLSKINNDIQKSLSPSNAFLTSEILYKRLYENLDTWDIQWFCCILQNRGWCVSHKINLVENIGFDEKATHTITSEFVKQPDAQEVDWQKERLSLWKK